MSKHNIVCAVCVQVLKSTDDIYSTSCGHIFHFACMHESISQSTCCPECRHFNPLVHEMFLAFDEREDEYLLHWNDKLKIIDLHRQMEDIKNNYLHLQEKYSASQDSVRILEGRLKKVDNSVSQRTLILMDLEDRVKTLEELNHFLTIDNECKSEALSLKSAEIAELQKSLMDIGEKDSVTSVLSKQIDILQRKLETQSIQLNNEVANSTQISTDKMKLMKYIDINRTETNGKQEAKNYYHPNRVLLSNPVENINTKVASGFYNSLKSNQNVPETSSLRDEIKQKPQCSTDENNFNQSHLEEDLNSFTDNCLLIKNFPKSHLMYPLKNVICVLTSINEEYNILDEEILNIYIEDGNGKTDKQLPKNVTLFVEFKNNDIKTKFLLNEYQISEVFPYLELTEIDNYEDDEKIVDDLLMYAKKKLCQNGFSHIFRQNDEIIALKGPKDSKGITIISKNQVNKLAKKSFKKKSKLF